MIPTEVAERILVEVNQEKEPKKPDTPEEAEFRKQLEKECADIAAQGYAVDVPREITVAD